MYGNPQNPQTDPRSQPGQQPLPPQQQPTGGGQFQTRYPPQQYPAGQPAQQQAQFQQMPMQYQQGQQPRLAPQPQVPSPRLQPVTIEEIVETDVVTAAPDTPVATIVAEMKERDVGSVVIVEEDRPVGIVTDRTIALSLETTPDLAERPVREFMVTDLATATTDMTLFDAIRTLENAGVRRLPLVDDNGRLAGIVTLDDIIVLLGSELGNAAQVIKAQVPRL